ncbi:MAG TPA: LysM peptidoglycan-binding domain-containing protein, partial [Mycobacterium sp.]
MQSHTVVAGDTLWALAQRFYGSGNLYPVIAAANAIPNPDHIEVGQVLSIPDTPLTDVSGTRSYIVVAGDTLSAIAQKFYGNARLFAVIAAFNKIPDPDHINVGRVLIIPAVSTVYVVAPGDTLFAIAQRFYGDGLKFGVIATFNGIGNPNLIFPGQVLAIPGVAAPTRPRSPVSALRRAVDAAEIEFDRFDALV